MTDYDPVGRIEDMWECTPFNCASGVLWWLPYKYVPGGGPSEYGNPAGYSILYQGGADARIGTILVSGLSGGTYPTTLAQISYAPQGAVSEIENGCSGTGCSNVIELNDYNNRLELVRSRLGTSSNAASLACVVYNFYGSVSNPTTCAIPSQGTGNDGNVLGKFDQDNANASLSHTTSLSYDPTHRLTGAVAAGSSTSSYNLAYSYDQFGNMTCQQNSQTKGLCPQHAFSASTNRITDSGYTYDASGDLTADGTHTFQYDAEGRLVSVDNGSTASYVYNALGERVERDLSGSYTEYIFDKDGNPLGENNRTTWVDTWVDFDGQHIAHYENNETYFVHSNQVGTASMVTDYSGALVQDELHYPWGQAFTTIGTQTEERFASLHHRDTGTNLDPTHFRMYSSDQGRWLTPDPAQADIYNPQSMSRYAYALGNPFSFIDMLGLATHPCGPMNGTEVYCSTSVAYSSLGLAVLPLVGQQTSALESGWFYVGWYGGSAAVGYAFAPAAYTEVSQAAAATAETYVPGSVQASTDFTSGVVTGDTSTTWALIGAVAGEADDIGNAVEGAADHVWNWLFC